MFKLARLSPVVVSGLLLTGAGCARTDDGTVVIPRQIDARRIWDKGSSGTQTPPVHSGSDVFPVVAPRYQPAAPARRTAPPSANAAPVTEPAGTTVSCGPAQDTGGRVRMVCQ
ncbi:hypothetical protein [Aquamicrobium terrae]|uniref:Lipoprotein n=1 Tax=Aquamicrobium terrae TaxID=1324945 RepID=A0ABV2N4H6_9HYPH